MIGSSIEWTDGSWNPWVGCVKVSPGCKNCYAETRCDKRFGEVVWGPLPKGTRVLRSDSYWREPRKWNKKAASEGVKYRVFCASLADVFEDWKGPMLLGHGAWKGSPLYLEPDGSWSTGGGLLNRDAERRKSLSLLTMQDVREQVWSMIDDTPNLIWQLLTKRPENVIRMTESHWPKGLPDNVWIGTSVEDQEQADKRIPELRRIPAKVRFLSCEPLLGPVDLATHLFADCDHCDGAGGWCPAGDPEGDEDCPHCAGTGLDYNDPLGELHWVIVGGESGPGKRPFDPYWGRRILADCRAADVPFFGKQWDKKRPLPDDLMVREFPIV